MQQLLMLYERSARGDFGSAKAADAGGVAAAAASAEQAERLSTAQHTLRVLATCCCLGGDNGRTGDLLAARALKQLTDMIVGDEEVTGLTRPRDATLALTLTLTLTLTLALALA